MHTLSVGFFATAGQFRTALEIDHLCRVTLCVRPDHLEAVTGLENAQRTEKAQRTHCLRGHEYTPENTGRHRSGRKMNSWTRYCKTCARLRAREISGHKRRLVTR